jgi:hypothetical protein
MFKHYRLLDYILAGLFAFFLLCLILRIKGAYTTRIYTDKEIAAQMEDEDFDGSLLRLNSLDKIIAYCDSFYAKNTDSRTYQGVVSEVIMKRFYHGYAHYNIHNNPLGVFLEPLVRHGATAIVLPDDILDYPNAACSQQSIIGMELWKRKGKDVRKVAMFDTVKIAGHFAYEVYYDNAWHFFDPDMEPDQQVLKSFKYPSVAFLKKHPEIIAAAYYKKDISFLQRLIASAEVGEINKWPAPNAYIYQVTTKFLTGFGWAFIWIVILVRNRMRKRKMRVVSRNNNADYRETQPAMSYSLGINRSSTSL